MSSEFLEWKAQLKSLKKDFTTAEFELDITPLSQKGFGNYNVVTQFANLNNYPRDIYHANNITNFEKITIPKKGKAESLNAAIATALILDKLV